MLPACHGPAGGAWTRRHRWALVLPLSLAGCAVLAGCADRADAAAPTFVGAVRGGDVAAVARMIDAVPRLARTPDGSGVTPLGEAIDAGSAPMVRLLLDRGARVDLPGPDGFLPLHRAVLAGDPAIVALLLERGADPDRRDPRGDAPILIALAHPRDCTDVVTLLLQHRANPDARRRSGVPALREALVRDRRLATLLLDAGADVDAADPQGRTTLHWAAQRGEVEVVEFLLARGALAGARDGTGKTPRDHASSGSARHRRIAEILEARERGLRPVALATPAIPAPTGGLESRRPHR